jgi:hypothetical protein
MSSATGASSATGQQGVPAWQQDWRWLVAWSVLALLLILINRTTIGRVATYYALALMLAFLIFTQFKFFADALAPFSELGPGVSPGEGPQGEK